MAYEQRELSGSLFKNERKTEEKHPNLAGSALIGGVEYWVSGWMKTTQKGDKWISLSFKPKSQGAAQPYEPKKPVEIPSHLTEDDPIPF